MRIIYNYLIPFPGFAAMAFFGYIFARKSAKPLSEVTINHEKIHAAQAKECGGWVPFYLRYLWFWLKCGYRNIPFEREAYDNERNLSYLSGRVEFAWKYYRLGILALAMKRRINENAIPFALAAIGTIAVAVMLAVVMAG